MGESTSHDDYSIGRIRKGQNVITSEKDGRGDYTKSQNRLQIMASHFGKWENVQIVEGHSVMTWGMQ